MWTAMSERHFAKLGLVELLCMVAVKDNSVLGEQMQEHDGFILDCMTPRGRGGSHRSCIKREQALVYILMRGMHSRSMLCAKRARRDRVFYACRAV